MNPTLSEGNTVIVDRVSYKFNEPEQFDIVVFQQSDVLMIKRIIGLPGDAILVKNNNLYINGNRVEQPFLKGFDGAYTEAFYLKNHTIPPDHYFVMGDNRQVSKDSRSFGFVSKESIEGKAITRLFPINEFAWNLNNEVGAEAKE